MPHDVWAPMITINLSIRLKSLRARSKVAHVELLRGLARLVPRYAVTVINRNQQRKKQKWFSVLWKKDQSQKTKNNDRFRKVVFLIKCGMRYAIYMPPNTEDLAINQLMVAYGNRQNAAAFTRANNSDLLRSLKHLMETRLYCRLV